MGRMEILLDKDTRYDKCKYSEMYLEALNKLKKNIFILMFVNIKIMDDNLDSIVVTVAENNLPDLGGSSFC